jgi:steroid 5-alpha reductase family enzyme
MEALGATMAIAAGALAVLMLVTWLISVKIEDVSIVDVVWGLTFVTSAIVATLVGGGDSARQLVGLVMVVLWGGRLAGFIGARKAGEGEEDRRYREMRERDPERFPLISFFKIFLLQGVLAWIVSLPLFGIGAATDGVGPLLYVGVVLWAVGLFFEAVGDQQNASFKADPDNKGKVNDQGLWKYTRHPNYFGDCTVWWGLYLVALDGGAWWSLPAPLIMTFLLTKGTGKGMTEKHMSKREGYAEYVERTSGFIPLPPKSKLARAT